MTDTLANLRAGCQKGEMPTLHAMFEIDERVTKAIPTTRFTDSWVEGYRPAYLDALHALQQALWPGSMVSVRPRGLVIDKDEYQVSIWVPSDDGGWPPVSRGKWCPTLATAWMDANLAGLTERDDG